VPPTWDKVCSRAHEPWEGDRIVINTGAKINRFTGLKDCAPPLCGYGQLTRQ
jgi:hypothetical protein